MVDLFWDKSIVAKQSRKYSRDCSYEGLLDQMMLIE